MRILLLTHSFNSLTQRLFEELSVRGHALSVEFDIADSVTYAVAGDAQDERVLHSLGVKNYDCAVVANGNNHLPIIVRSPIPERMLAEIIIVQIADITCKNKNIPYRFQWILFQISGVI